MQEPHLPTPLTQEHYAAGHALVRRHDPEGCDRSTRALNPRRARAAVPPPVPTPLRPAPQPPATLAPGAL